LKLYRHEASRGLFATAELLVIVYSRLDRGIQSATEMLPSLEKGCEDVAHSFDSPASPYGGYFVLLTHLLNTF